MPMKEQVLFHLRLEGITATAAESTLNPQNGVTPSRPQPSLLLTAISTPSKNSNSGSCSRSSNADVRRTTLCTCIDSSSPTCVVVGFERGLVHIFDRVLLPGNGSLNFEQDEHRCEEERWRHTAVYPTRALGGNHASLEPPDITCVQRGPDGMLAVGTANGFVFVTQPPPSNDRNNSKIRGAGFHHKSHRGRRVNCLLWDPSGDQLFSVCEGGTVILARNLQQRRRTPPTGPGGVATVVTSLMPFLGGPTVRVSPWNEPVVPQAIIVGQLGSPGVQLDLGRAKTALRGVKRDCDVLLVMTRKRAVLLYFSVGDDVSIIAPYEASVDLNLTAHVAEAVDRANEGIPGTSKPPPPPSKADLGGCLWGPPNSCDAASSRSAGVEQAVREPGALDDQPLHQAFTVGGVPRTVAFAYVAQPGGRLWRVGLSDGEVESTFRPPVCAQGAGVDTACRDVARGAVTGGHVEIGRVQTVTVGDSQSILCWRSSAGEGEGDGELALLDPSSHTFVDVCQGLKNVVGLSGCRLAESSNLGGDPILATTRSGSLAAVAAVRVLHAGEVAKVSELYTGKEPDNSVNAILPEHQEPTSERHVADTVVVNAAMVDEVAAAESAETSAKTAAARTVQRAWRERRRRRLAVWEASIVPSYNFRTKPAMPGDEVDSRPPTNAAARGSTRGVLRAGSSGFDSNSSRYARGVALGGGLRGQDGFSILESLGALDAAERVLRLSNKSRLGSSRSVASRLVAASAPATTSGGWSSDEAKGWLIDRSRSPLVTRNSEGLGGGGSPGSGGEASARALVRTTDELLRETAPVLRRTRSLLVFSPPQESPLAGRIQARALEDWDGPKRGLQTAAAIAREGERVESLAAAMVTEASSEDHGAVILGASEDPHSAGSKADEHSSRSKAISPAPSRASNVPYPAHHGQEQTVGAGGRATWAVQSMPFPHTPDRERRRHSGPRTQQEQHNGLLGPVQNVVGTLLQRAGQAVNDALQPGGGATSDDSSPYDDEETMFAHEQEADDGMTSDTGKTAYSTQFSSDSHRSDYRSDLDDGVNPHRSTSAVTIGPPGSRNQPTSAQDSSSERKDTSMKGAARGEKGQRADKRMLFVSGMMGVKRQSLAALRSRRGARMNTGAAAVVDLPPSAVEDPSPFVPPSQYEVRLNVSRGLGLSLQITGNEVRVKGFPPVLGGGISPAQACGQIQVGDVLLGVNTQRLTLLNHSSVVEVLRSLVSVNGSQLVLFRFQYAEGQQSEARQANPRPPQTSPEGTPSSPLGTPLNKPQSTTLSKDDTFRPESWHGSTSKGVDRGSNGGVGAAGGDAREHARSVSPPHSGGREAGSDDGCHSASASSSLTLPTSVSVSSRRHSIAVGARTQGSGTAAVGSALATGQEEGSANRAEGTGAGGMKVAKGDHETGMGQAYATSSGGEGGSDSRLARASGSAGGGLGNSGRRQTGSSGELWGEHGVGGRPTGSRHVYLGDMGHARAQKTLGYIAQDVQGLHRLQHSSEQARFFHGRSRLSLADPSPNASENRIPPPSALVLTTIAESATQLPPPPPLNSAESPETLEQPPPLPPRPLRGRRRRRPRRRRSTRAALYSMTFGSESWMDTEGSDRREEGGVIDIGSCRQVMEGELWRLEKGLERQRARLERQRDRRSSVDNLVSKVLLQRSNSTSNNTHHTASLNSAEDSLSPRPHCHPFGRTSRTSGALRSSWRFKGSGPGTRDVLSPTGFSDGFTDDDSEDEGAAAISRAGAGKRQSSRQTESVGPEFGVGGEVKGGEGGLVRAKEGLGRKGPEPACDIVLEAVSTGGMLHEMMSALPAEMLGIAPPRPLPSAAYDLLTALESVQHFATRILAGVVQSEATNGSFALGFDDTQAFRQPRSGSHSPIRGGGGARAAATALFAKEQADAAGLGEEWEKAWPPRELTAALALVTARQMAHAMRCDSEPLMQVWMRCFTPLDIKHRDTLWTALSPSRHNSYDGVSGAYHRQLVCGLVTLFAQVHVSWAFLAKPCDDPILAVGLMSLRLETTWFGAQDTNGVDNNAYNDASQHGFAPGSTAQSSPSGKGMGESGNGEGGWGGADGVQRGPAQWDEEKTVDFFQEYGCYLDADSMAAAASCREMAWALQEALSLAAQCQVYKNRERHLHQLIRGPRSPMTRTPLSRSPPIASIPVHSPASTPGTRTPTVHSPRSPSFYSSGISPLAVADAIDRASSAPTMRPMATGDVGPMEEDAVRKILGLKSARDTRNVTSSRDPSHPDFIEKGLFQGGQASAGGSVRGVLSQGGGGGDVEEGDGFETQDHTPGSSMLCLLLRNLGELFRWDTASAADICADAFPRVRPWNVHHALHQASPWGVAEPSTPVHAATPTTSTQGRYQYPTGDNDIGARYDAAFHAYLWATMQKHPFTCFRDWKMVQRCLQLSLRIGTRLRSLPPQHPLHSHCLAATRNFGRETAHTNVHEESSNYVSGSPVVDSRPDWHTNNIRNRLPESFSALGGRYREPRSSTSDHTAWRRYSDVVEEIALLWCRDPDAVDLDPLWLLQKLRVHRQWPMAFQVCAAVTRSWEERPRDVDDTNIADDENVYGYHPLNGRRLAPTLAVLDTLAEACFASFDEGDTACLASALCAAWAADGALRRATIGISSFGEGFDVGGDRGSPSPVLNSEVDASTPQTASETMQGRANGASISTREKADSEAPFKDGGIASAGADNEDMGVCDEEWRKAEGSSRRNDLGAGRDGGAYSTGRKYDEIAAGKVPRGIEAIAEPNGEQSYSNFSGAAWVHESRTVEIVRRLAHDCRDYHHNDEVDNAGADMRGAGGGRGRLRGDSIASGGPVWEWPSSTLSMLELGEALADGVGPEATGDVLSACPVLLEGMPPEFFRRLADRHAALHRQRALEATLLNQAAAAVLALGGNNPGGSVPLADELRAAEGRRSGTGSDRVSPLGPWLAWLACEELTSFFQQHENTLPGRRVVESNPLFALMVPPSPHLPVRRLLDPTTDNGVTTFGEKMNSGDVHSSPQQQRWSFGAGEVLRHATSKTGLNVVLPGRAHQGVTLRPGSSCIYCGLPLSAQGRSSYPGAEAAPGSPAVGIAYGGVEGLKVSIARSGRWYHVRCDEESHVGACWQGVSGVGTAGRAVGGSTNDRMRNVSRRGGEGGSGAR